MDRKIAENLAKVEQELQTLRSEKREYERSLASYRSQGIDQQVEAALSWATGHLRQLIEKESQLLEERQKLQNPARSAEMGDLNDLWQASTHRFR